MVAAHVARSYPSPIFDLEGHPGCRGSRPACTGQDPDAAQGLHPALGHDAAAGTAFISEVSSRSRVPATSSG